MRATIRTAFFGLLATLSLPAAPAFAQADPSFKYVAPEDTEKVVWEAQVRAGILMSGGNSTLTNISGGATVSRNDGKNKVLLNAEGAYATTTSLTDTNGNGTIDPGEEQTATTVKKWEVSLRYDRFFTKNNKLYILGIVGANEIAGKSLYAGGQLGYSRQLYKSDMHELLLEAGLDYSHERYVAAGQNPLNIFSLRAFFGDNMVFSKDTSLTLGVEYLGNLLKEQGRVINFPAAATDASYFEDSRVNAKAALTTKLTTWMSLGVSFTAKYDNVPAVRPGYKIASEKLDTLAEASLIVNLL